MRELLIATHNKGKLKEMQKLLEGLPFKVLSMDDTDIPADFRVDESATTFEGNALIKAIICGKKSGLLTIADDSGVHIDALGGEPGVRSARYIEGSDTDRYEYVLKRMKDVEESKRAARFVASIALYDPVSEKVRVTEGVCEGKILREPKGEHGFGYDPIFYANDLGATFAEVSTEVKQTGDHRGKAMVKMREVLIAEFA